MNTKISLKQNRFFSLKFIIREQFIGIWEHSGYNYIRCPLCREDTFEIPDELKNNFLVNQFLSLTEKVFSLDSL